MKNLLVVVLLLAARAAGASPYFRPVDLSHTQPLLGAFVEPKASGSSEAGALLPIYTHSTRDGCLLPSIVCEDWSPLALGGVVNAGHFKAAAGASLNIAPLLQHGGTYLLDLLTNQAPGLRGQLTPTDPNQGFDVRVSVSPTFVLDPFFRNAAGKRTGHGYFRLFVGPQLLF